MTMRTFLLALLVTLLPFIVRADARDPHHSHDQCVECAKWKFCPCCGVPLVHQLPPLVYPQPLVPREPRDVIRTVSEPVVSYGDPWPRRPVPSNRPRDGYYDVWQHGCYVGRYYVMFR